LPGLALLRRERSLDLRSDLTAGAGLAALLD